MPLSLEGLQSRLGYQFSDTQLLKQALVHRSFSANNNERLEFLGDGVLNCVIGSLLYERFPELKEGQLSRMRANLVNQQPLFEIAMELGLGHYLLLGEGELRSGGSSRPSILADALESILGAIFLDAGFDAARSAVLRLFSNRLNEVNPDNQGKDAKTLLQEWLQSRHHGLPSYELLSTTGQAHAQVFLVACRIDVLGVQTEGTGPNRKTAEQAAAQAAYEKLSRR